MKILTLNIWGGRLERQIIDLLEAEKPDYICLQEAISLEGGNAGLFITLEGISKTINKSLAFAPVYLFKYMNRTAGFGNAILSNEPAKNENTIFTIKELTTNFDTIEHDYNVRNLLHATYELNGEPLHILTHHGHHVETHKNGDEETMRQSGEIADYIKKLDGKVILTGDFNLAPHSESLEQINSVLTNLCIQHNIKTTRTPLTHKKEVCDYIFVNSAVTVKNFRVSDEIASDHSALVMEFA